MSDWLLPGSERSSIVVLISWPAGRNSSGGWEKFVDAVLSHRDEILSDERRKYSEYFYDQNR